MDASDASARTPFFKKLNQLHKVVEYLSFHLDEHNFQVETLRKRFEDAEDQIIQEAQKKVQAIYSNIKIGNTDAVKRGLEYFDQQVQGLKGDMSTFCDDLLKTTKRQASKIKAHLNHYKKAIVEIQKGLDEQIAALTQDISCGENESEAAKILEENKRFEEQIRIHDEEGARKQTMLEEMMQDKEKQIARQYGKQINDLKRKLRPSRAFMVQFDKGNRKLLTGARSLQGEAQYCSILMRRANVSIFTTMRRQAKLMANDMRQMLNEIETSKNTFEVKTAEENARFESFRDQLRKEQKEKQEQYNKETDALIEALKEFDPVEKLKRELGKERDRIETTLAESSENVRLYKDYIAQKEEHGVAVADLEADLEHDREKLSHECLKEQRGLREILKTAKELDFLKVFLSDLSKSRDKGPVVCRMTKAMVSEELEVQSVLDEQYELKTTNSARKIAEERQRIEQEQAELQKRIDEKIRTACNEIEREFVEDSFTKGLREKYESVCKELTDELDEIDVPDENMEDPVEPMKQQHMKLLTDIGAKRDEIVHRYEILMRQEQAEFEAAHPPEPEEDGRVSLKDQLQQKKDSKMQRLDAEIADLEAQIRKFTQAMDKQSAKVTSDCHKKIKEARQKSTEQSKAIINQIAEEKEKYSAILRKERSEMHSEDMEFDTEIEALRTKINANHKRYDANELNLLKTYMARKNEIKNKSRLEFDRINREISMLNKEMINADQQIHTEMKEDQVKFEAMLTQMSGQMVVTKHKADTSSIDFTNNVNRLTRERNRAKSRFENAGMREQERQEIDRLEGILAEKSLELSQYGHELVKMKQELAPPEDRRQSVSASNSPSKLPRLRKLTM